MSKTTSKNNVNIQRQTNNIKNNIKKHHQKQRQKQCQKNDIKKQHQN